MKCPIDGAELVMSERQGIEIDYCPTCRGVWLDRGELDKIIERSVAAEPPAAQIARAPYPAEARDDRRSEYGGYRGHEKPHKKKSFLGELFDF